MLDEVDLDVRPSEIVGLVGPNGAGKTTAFRIMAGLIRADRGTVHLADRDVSRQPLHQRARCGLGYLAQEPSVFRRLTVRANLEAVLALQPDRSRQDMARRVDATLRRFGLEARSAQLADRLSGGERRRLELARSLIVGPRWLLLDEPFAGIDPIGVADLQARLRTIREERVAVLITDHNVHATLPICDRAYLLQEGRIVAHGSDLAASRVAREAYLGAQFALDATGEGADR